MCLLFKIIVRVLTNKCIKCGEIYTNEQYKWCKPCRIDYFKKNFINWTSGNEEIDRLTQEMQLRIINNYKGTVFEWVPYDQFSNIKKIGKDKSSTVYSAIWKDGPLSYSLIKKEYARNPGKMIALRCPNTIDKFLDEISTKYSTNGRIKMYGISQNPNTKKYMIILHTNYFKIYFKEYCIKCGEIYTNTQNQWCKQCNINYFRENFTNWTSGNKKVDNLIQEMQLKINDYNDIIFEWIPFNQFTDIKKLGKNDLNTAYSATWKDGPLLYDQDQKKYTRVSDEIVTLKCFGNLQCMTNEFNEFLNKAKTYSIKRNGPTKNNIKIYGISQNHNTKNYIMVLENHYFEKYCMKCDMYSNWCAPCQIDALKKNFTNWTSGNKKVDNLIQEMQLKINKSSDIIFEWIPYNQFDDIKKIGKGGFSTVYSGTWKNGSLNYDLSKKEYTRELDKTIALKCLDDSQNITNHELLKFLNEVKAYSINNFDNCGKILQIYGISQNPSTGDYIMVLQYAKGGNFNDWINNNYKNFDWPNKLKVLDNIINGLKEIHQKKMVHRDLHVGNILFKETYWISSNYIADMGLCGKAGDIDERNIYGVLPYVAPEVLRGEPYTQAADIYSFGMIMYFVATERQPFFNRAHDELLAIDICNGTRPKINEQEAPECYIDLMKKCWDSNPVNRFEVTEIAQFIRSFYNSYCSTTSNTKKEGCEIKKIENQFKEAEGYRKANKLTIHSQASIHKSQLLNSLTQGLPKFTDECLECSID